MATIEVEIGSLHASLHDQMKEMLGDEYSETVRNEMEDMIHDTYRRVERAQEQSEDPEDVEIPEAESADA